jgi:hypothetical protein
VKQNNLEKFIEKRAEQHPVYKYSIGNMDAEKCYVQKSIETHHWKGSVFLGTYTVNCAFECDCGAKCHIHVDDNLNEFFTTPTININFECDDFECTIDWDIKDIIE